METQQQTTTKELVLTWDLEDLLPLDQFDELCDSVTERIKLIPEWLPRLLPTMSEEDFQEFVDLHETLTADVHRLYNRANLFQYSDQQSKLAKKLKAKADDLDVQQENAFKAHMLWLAGKKIEGKEEVLDETNAKRLFSSIPNMEYFFTHEYESASHLLSVKEETIITQKNQTGKSVLYDLYTLRQSDFRFTFGVDGSVKELNSAEIKSYMHHPNEQVRGNAYRLFLTEQEKNINFFHVLYQGVVKDGVQDARLRGFPEAISLRNHENHVPDSVIDILLETVEDNRGIFEQYFKWKARQLGKKVLNRFDVHAPLATKRINMPFQDALAKTLETFNEFSPTFASFARRIVDAEHVDSHPRDNKSNVGFQQNAGPGRLPYVLLCYKGNFADVTIVAHELGHGVHSIYAGHHSLTGQKPQLPLAETASTFSELLLFKRLLSELSDNEARRTLLAAKMTNTQGLIGRQCDFTIFERKAHELIMQGATADELSDLYLETVYGSFKDSLTVDPCLRFEWASVLHFFYKPFYCYAYPFGNLLAMGFYKRYENEGKVFIPEIEKILSHGGTRNPVEALLEIGIDITTKEFLQSSFDVIKGWQEELTALDAE